MRKILLLAIILLVASSAVLFLLEMQQPNNKTKISFVQRVIDGDTVILADGIRVRLIGIDTPEKDMPCFEESKEFLHQIVSGKAVEVAFDIEKKDKYGRTLAYLFVDGNFTNLEMVESGFAVAFPFEPNLLHAVEFASAEQNAREQQKGCLWK